MRVSILALFFGLFSISLYSQRVLVIDETPANTPPDASIYLAATINSWNPGDENFTFTEVNGVLMLDIPESAPYSFQGKITRGSWGRVEGSASGGNIVNRTFSFSTSDT